MINQQHNIIAYPLDSVITTPMLYYILHTDNSINWTTHHSAALVFTDYESAQTVAIELRKMTEYLILVHPLPIVNHIMKGENDND